MPEVYLHECDEQEEGVSGPSDLLIQEPGQKGEDPILGGTAAEDRDRGLFLKKQEGGKTNANVCKMIFYYRLNIFT